MNISEIIGILLVWNIVGIIIIAIASVYSNFIDFEYGFNWLSPVHIYDKVKVNWFGCLLLTILVNALCPLATFCYWFYRLCKVGRK